MSIFAKGDFSIKQSWSKDKGTPKTEHKRNSILQNAAKNIFQPTHNVLDDKIAKKVFNQFNFQGPIEGIHSYHDIRTPSRDSDKGLRKQPVSSKNILLPPKQKTDKNNDLMTSMASRLAKVQQTCNSQRLQLKQKTDQINKLKDQNNMMKKLKNNPQFALKQITLLKQQNTKLITKIEQMEVFLKSYGLRWVGNKMQGKLDKEQLKKDLQKPKYNYHLPSQVDINTVARRIQQLNMGLQKQGVSSNQVFKDQNGLHRFRAAQPLLIGFYKQGIAIQGYTFFPYKSKESIQILGDILDGYFPYVLKSKYPNGTFLKIMDKIDYSYNQEDQKGGIKTFQSVEDKLMKPMSKQQFLNKLPKSITKNGKIIQIRAAIQNKLQGKKDIPIIKQQSQNQYYEEDQEGVIVFKTPQVDEQQTCCLKVRTQIGQICLLKLNINAKMSEVYKWMRHVSKSKNGFKVLNNYPKREYSQQQQQTLEELGLAPNSVLHLQLIK